MKIAIYTDDAPISENKLASGMSRVNTRLFAAIKDEISLVVTTNQHGNYALSDLESSLLFKIKVFKCNQFISKIFSKVNFMLSKYFVLGVDLAFWMKANAIIKSIIDSDSQVLFIPLGSNIRAYKRAAIISGKTGLPLAVYIVDDFLDASRLSADKYGVMLCEDELKKWLHQTKTIFVISEGMKAHFKNNYNVESIVLNLPFEKKYAMNETVTRQILFLGSLSHFYEDGLIELLEVLLEYNKIAKSKITLRLTTDKLDCKYKKYEDIIVYSKVQGDENLAREINKSLFCFVPYSFDCKYTTMVSTSFPSKTLEYLSYAKQVVIYGPSYSSVVKYFKSKNLDTCINIHGPERLFEVIKKIDSGNVIYSDKYTEAVQNYHAYEYIKKILLENICE
jgi:hypothetical protein